MLELAFNYGDVLNQDLRELTTTVGPDDRLVVASTLRVAADAFALAEGEAKGR